MKILCFLPRLYRELSPKEGAQTQLYMSYLPFYEFVSGAYYDRCAIGKMSDKCKDKQLRTTVINWTIRILKDKIHQEELKVHFE